MKFEITYQNGSKVVVDVADIEVRAWLDNRAKHKTLADAEKAESDRGPATSAKVVA